MENEREGEGEEDDQCGGVMLCKVESKREMDRHADNKSVFEEVEMEQGDLLKRVIRRKATFVGHISRMNDDRLLKRVWEIRDGTSRSEKGEGGGTRRGDRYELTLQKCIAIIFRKKTHTPYFLGRRIFTIQRSQLLKPR